MVLPSSELFIGSISLNFNLRKLIVTNRKTSEISSSIRNLQLYAYVTYLKCDHKFDRLVVWKKISRNLKY